MIREFRLNDRCGNGRAETFTLSGNAPESVLRPVAKPTLGIADVALFFPAGCGGEAAPILLGSSTRPVQASIRDRLRGASLFGNIKH
jgi:hypothetical protein